MGTRRCARLYAGCSLLYAVAQLDDTASVRTDDFLKGD
jgi:hypothetical protein